MIDLLLALKLLPERLDALRYQLDQQVLRQRNRGKARKERRGAQTVLLDLPVRCGRVEGFDIWDTLPMNQITYREFARQLVKRYYHSSTAKSLAQYDAVKAATHRVKKAQRTRRAET